MKGGIKCDKKALLIASNLTSFCCVYKEKIVKNDNTEERSIHINSERCNIYPLSFFANTPFNDNPLFTIVTEKGCFQKRLFRFSFFSLSFSKQNDRFSKECKQSIPNGPYSHISHLFRLVSWSELKFKTKNCFQVPVGNFWLD